MKSGRKSALKSNVQQNKREKLECSARASLLLSKSHALPMLYFFMAPRFAYALLVQLFSALLCAAAAQAQVPGKLEARTALGGRVSLLVPESFKPLPENLLRLKYPAEQRPTEVLSNAQGSVNLTFNYTQNALRAEQVAEAYPTLDKLFRNLYPSAHWNRSEVISRGGRDFLILDLWTPAADTEIRNIILGTSAGDRLLLVSFNVTKELEGEWGGVGEQMIDSVRVRE